jgi:hypothetical protein
MRNMPHVRQFNVRFIYYRTCRRSAQIARQAAAMQAARCAGLAAALPFCAGFAAALLRGQRI